MPTLQETGQAYEAALNNYKTAYEAFPVKKLADGTEARDIPADKLKGLNDMLGEVETTGKAFDDMRKLEDRSGKAFDRLGGGAERPGAPAGGKAAADGTVQKSLGELFVESKAFSSEEKQFRKDVEALLDVDVKTTMTTAAGWQPETTRSGRVVLSAQRPPQVMDVIPSGTISQVANKYMRETVFTNAAAEVAEGGAFPEAALQLVEVNDPVQKVAVLLPVTDEQLEDVDGIRSYIDNRLELMLKQRIDTQILNGTGTGSTLKGYLTLAGLQTQARGTDPAFDAWLKLLTKLMDNPGFCSPSAILMNPVDRQNLFLTRTADGIYILGNPGDSTQSRLWGLPIVGTSVLTQGTGMAGDWQAYTELLFYRGVTMKITDSNADDFTKGKQCIRADIRLVNTCYRSTALGTVTGL